MSAKKRVVEAGVGMKTMLASLESDDSQAIAPRVTEDEWRAANSHWPKPILDAVLELRKSCMAQAWEQGYEAGVTTSDPKRQWLLAGRFLNPYRDEVAS